MIELRLRRWLGIAAGPATASRRFSWIPTVGVQLVAVVLSTAFLLAVLSALGYRAGGVLSALWDGSVGSKVAIGLTLNEATPLMLAGVAVWLAAQSGLFNIGADGQLQLGGVAALVATSDLGLPHSGPLLIVVGLVAAALTGAMWAGIAALMKAYRGANEIIATLMLNFIAFIVIDQLIQGPLKSTTDAFSAQTNPIPVAAEIKPLVAGTQITWSVILAAVVALCAVVVVRRTLIGLRLRAVGLNHEAARLAGMRSRVYWIGALTASGALCGLAGGLVILGLRFYVAPGWAGSWGFEGILVAFLAFRTPYLIPLWGVLFGMVSAAGPTLQADVSVPNSIVTLMQTLPVIALFLLYGAGRLMTRRRTSTRSPTVAESVPGVMDDLGEIETITITTRNR